MKNLIILLQLFLTTLFSFSNRYPVEIQFNNIQDLNKLNHLEIHYDHHRTKNSVHAFVDDNIYVEIQLSGLKITPMISSKN